MLLLIILLAFTAILLASYALLPSGYEKLIVVNENRHKKFSNNMESMMDRKEASKIGRYFVFAPLLLPAVFYFVFPEGFKLIGAAMGISLGLFIPGVIISFMKRRAADKFSNQLIDALMIMSSSFRGGLSLVQAIEAVVDEMPDPINREFGTVLGENKMGVSLEDALYHLYNRLPSTALQQMITSILLARETGGNLPVIFSRIVTNIRESKKIQQNIDTLTIQGKIQGAVMSILPLAFGGIVYSANRRIFQHMIHSEIGKGMLIAAAVLEVLGVFFILKISTFKDY